MMPSRKKEIVFLVSLFFLGFILRIIYCFLFRENILYIQSHIFGDTQAYIRIAKNFLSGEGLIASPDKVAYYPPIYPIFLAGIYGVFGDGYWPIRIIQSILAGLTCVIVYQLGKMVLDGQTGMIAGFICAIYPFFIFYTGFVLTETLFIFLLLMTIFFFYRSIKTPTWKNLSLTGMLAGITVLTRPTFVGFILLFYLSFIFLKGWKNKNCFKIGGVIFIFLSLTILPWTVRNFYHLKAFIPLTTMGGVTFWEGNNPYATGGPCQYWPQEIKDLSEIERNRYLTRKTLQVIWENPLRFIRLSGVKFIRFWNIVPNYEGFSSPLYHLTSLFSYLPVLITAMWGIFLTRKRWKNFLMFYFVIISFTIIHMIFVGSIRYREPIMPFIIIFSGYTIMYLWRKFYSFL